MITYTERSQKDAKDTARVIGMEDGFHVRQWDASEDDFNRTGFLAVYSIKGDEVLIYPLWAKEEGTGTDLPDAYNGCPSLEWFMTAKLEDHGEPELVGVDGDKLVW